jgi:FkbM family methyltransferase
VKVAHDELVKKARKDPLWEVAPRMALGAENGTVEMHVSANVLSSSALKMLPAHLNAAPGSMYVATESVPLRTLDELSETILLPEDANSIFIKLDVQGYETKVIEGGKHIFSRATGVQVELSLVPLYAGQKLFDEVIGLLKVLGFSLAGVVPGFVDVNTGRMLQFDGIFFR